MSERYVVQKPFRHGDSDLKQGDVVDTSDFANGRLAIMLDQKMLAPIQPEPVATLDPEQIARALAFMARYEPMLEELTGEDTKPATKPRGGR